MYWSATSTIRLDGDTSRARGVATQGPSGERETCHRPAS